ncbi:MAG: 8-oxo-dGTP diphosphatase [Lachnospiraceae bacterium]|nr:8-oxo-dGTP diphosphatase [Lachnospiraceae bacterium]
MLNTTLCYIEKDNKYLMLHRVKKVNDLNHDKWVGIGGKFMENETPDECLLREVKEETGLTLTEYRLRGIVTFLSDKWEGEYMYLFTATDYTGEMIECDEGNLEWVPVDKVCDLPIWEGDKLFFNELSNGKSFFTMMLKYEGERLIDHSVKYHG